jgi:hypothetical protein
LSTQIWDTSPLLVSLCAHQCERCFARGRRCLCIDSAQTATRCETYICMPCWRDLCAAVENALRDSIMSGSVRTLPGEDS